MKTGDWLALVAAALVALVVAVLAQFVGAAVGPRSTVPVHASPGTNWTFTARGS